MKFSTGKDLLFLSLKHNLPIHQIMLQREAMENNQSEEAILQRLKESLSVMRHSVNNPLHQPDKKYYGKIIGGESAKIWRRLDENPLCGYNIALAVAYSLAALEVNASMGKVVAAPTAGSCGVLPALLFSLEKTQGLKEEDLLKGLLTAGAVGIVYASKATISGAVGGCQAEVGVASSIAAAAAVEIMGGSPEQALDASSIAMSNVLGLVCDPIAGLVESPCNTRNAMGVANALLAADIILAGIKAVVPFDEMVEAMYRVGNNIPSSLRETALGGMAITPSAIAHKKRIDADKNKTLNLN
ncbi:MAG: L-serine ammonia-lyase, iron-sulfur-dependent, subunit alpha [Bacillota bacterium]|jgi:L-serine dehydratase